MRTIRRWWTVLHHHDPWATWGDRHPSGGLITSATTVRLRFFGGVGAWLFAALAVWMSRPWLLVILVPAGLLLVATAWREPSFAVLRAEPRDLVPGRLYVPLVPRTVEGRDDLVPSWKTSPVIAAFQHHARTRPWWIALAGGEALELSSSADVGVADKDDWFRRWRPVATSEPEVCVDTSTVLPLLGHLWNARTAGTADVPLDGLDQDLRRHLDEADLLTLVEVDGPRRHPHSVRLSGSGHVVVAAAIRDAGEEPYDDSGEQRMVYVHNKGVWIQGSPGAAVVQGSGRATGGDVSGLDPSIAEHLRCLIEILRHDSSDLDPEDADIVETAADTIEDQLAHDVPDHRRLKTATRTVLGVAQQVILGARVAAGCGRGWCTGRSGSRLDIAPPSSGRRATSAHQRLLDVRVAVLLEHLDDTVAPKMWRDVLVEALRQVDQDDARPR